MLSSLSYTPIKITIIETNNDTSADIFLLPGINQAGANNN